MNALNGPPDALMAVLFLRPLAQAGMIGPNKTTGVVGMALLSDKAPTLAVARLDKINQKTHTMPMIYGQGHP